MVLPWKNHVQVVARQERLATLSKEREARKRVQDVGAGGDAPAQTMPPPRSDIMSAPLSKKSKVTEASKSKSKPKSNEPPAKPSAQELATDSADTEDEDR